MSRATRDGSRSRDTLHARRSVPLLLHCGAGRLNVIVALVAIGRHPHLYTPPFLCTFLPPLHYFDFSLARSRNIAHSFKPTTLLSPLPISHHHHHLRTTLQVQLSYRTVHKSHHHLHESIGKKKTQGYRDRNAKTKRKAEEVSSKPVQLPQKQENVDKNHTKRKYRSCSAQKSATG